MRCLDYDKESKNAVTVFIDQQIAIHPRAGLPIIAHRHPTKIGWLYIQQTEKFKCDIVLKISTWSENT
jgi:hypothetical protein